MSTADVTICCHSSNEPGCLALWHFEGTLTRLYPSGMSAPSTLDAYSGGTSAPSKCGAPNVRHVRSDEPRLLLPVVSQPLATASFPAALCPLPVTWVLPVAVRPLSVTRPLPAGGESAPSDSDATSGGRSAPNSGMAALSYRSSVSAHSCPAWQDGWSSINVKRTDFRSPLLQNPTDRVFGRVPTSWWSVGLHLEQRPTELGFASRPQTRYQTARLPILDLSSPPSTAVHHLPPTTTPRVGLETEDVFAVSNLFAQFTPSSPQT